MKIFADDTITYKKEIAKKLNSVVAAVLLERMVNEWHKMGKVPFMFHPKEMLRERFLHL